MRISAKEKIGPWQNILICTPDGEKLGMVFACDTEEKWIEQYVMTTGGKAATVFVPGIGYQLMIRRDEQARFDVVNRSTGEVLAEVR
jgi:hypothetical protein